jgi:hypothetical protein
MSPREQKDKPQQRPETGARRRLELSKDARRSERELSREPGGRRPLGAGLGRAGFG